jgi:hypothetical protein
VKATFELTLPDGKKVLCWKKDAARIRHDVRTTGTVRLVRPQGAEVYEYLAPGSVEAKLFAPSARRVG